MRTAARFTLAAAAFALAACSSADGSAGQGSAERGYQTDAPAPSATRGVRVETVVSGLDRPWALEFLPDRRMLVTEKGGCLRLFSENGARSWTVRFVPEVDDRGQGGLLDVAVDPRFDMTGLIVLTLAEPAGGRTNRTAAIRARLILDEDPRLEDLRPIFRQTPAFDADKHYGSRAEFAPDGTVYVTTGERFDHARLSQDLNATLGKVVRVNVDGTIPADNPFVGRDDARPETWSYGHRNIQSAAIHPDTGRLWTIEHGPRGGDEVNVPEAGENYGWPLVTHGRAYSGLPINGGRSAQEGTEQPLYYWVPSIAPSGATFYTGDRFPEWKGDLFSGALAGQHLNRLDVENGRVVGEERLLTDLGERIRDVRQGPDGFLYVLTDGEDAEILRLTPR